MTTTDDKLALGRQIACDRTFRDMMRGDPPRPLTNVEMAAFVYYRQRALDRIIERHGCCGGEISLSGRCPESGRMCPMAQKARRIEWQTFQAKEKP